MADSQHGKDTTHVTFLHCSLTRRSISRFEGVKRQLPTDRGPAYSLMPVMSNLGTKT